MFKTGDGYEVRIGMWLENTSGVYEVTSIEENYVSVKEVIFEDDESDKYQLGDTYRMTKQEMKHVYYE